MDKNLAQGEKKILLQFNKFIETDFFKTEVKKIRKVLNIPTEGYLLSEKKLKNIHKYIKTPDKSERSYTSKPQGLWFYWECNSKYPKEVNKILAKLPVSNNYIEMLIRNYIYYNIFLYEELKEYINPLESICSITDKEEDYDNYSIDEDPESSFNIESHNGRLFTMLSKFPVSVHIHAEASQNDIIDYIKKNWKVIKEYQDKYINRNNEFYLKNSKTKENKELKKRNDFIYKHKHLSRKEIMAMVNKDFGADLDQGSIGKIISLERKKREKK